MLSPEALRQRPRTTTVLLGDNAFASPPEAPDSVVQLLGHTVVITSTGAESGGPGPTPADDPLALRQRLLSEAALRLTARRHGAAGGHHPQRLGPCRRRLFFSGLDEPWLDVVGVTDVAGRPATDLPASSLAYPGPTPPPSSTSPTSAPRPTLSDTAALLEQVLSSQDHDRGTGRATRRSSRCPSSTAATPRWPPRPPTRIADALRADLGSIRIQAPTSASPCPAAPGRSQRPSSTVSTSPSPSVSRPPPTAS